MDEVALRSYVNTALRELWLSETMDSLFKEIVAKIIAGSAESEMGAKRLRPLLAMLGMQAMAGHAILPATPVPPIFISLEIIHELSVVLDDFMDGDVLRRNQSTIWVSSGASKAITASFGMFAGAYKLLFDWLSQVGAKGQRAMTLFHTAVMELHDAQLQDLESERGFMTDLEGAVRIGYGRSSLIARAPEIGAVLVAEDIEASACLGDYGRNFAIAYSLLDDYRNLWCDARLIGKLPGSDIRQRKKTYPIVAAYLELSIPDQARMVSGFSHAAPLADRLVDDMLALINRTTAAEKTLFAAEIYRSSALKALSRFEELKGCSPASRRLAELADQFCSLDLPVAKSSLASA